jgi:ABC-2 type transport system permease protein
LLLALVLLGGIIFKNIYGSLLFTGAAVVVMTVVNIFPTANPFNPSTLASNSVYLLTGGQDVADFVSALGVSAVLIALLLALSIVIFNKKQI